MKRRARCRQVDQFERARGEGERAIPGALHKRGHEHVDVKLGVERET